MAWIESHQELERHPKTLDLMGLMDWDMDVTLGKLHRFWWWCVDYAEDGDLRKHNDDRLARAVGLNGGAEARRFVEGMVTARWLDREPYFRVHNWWDYAGRYLQGRYSKTPEKWQKIKGLYKVAGIHTETVGKPDLPNQTEPNQTVPNQTKNKGGDKPPRPSFEKPSLVEVQAFIAERGYHVDAEKWWNHYQSNGWRVGRNQMRDWRAAVVTWTKGGYDGGNKASAGGSSRPPSGFATPRPGGERTFD